MSSIDRQAPPEERLRELAAQVAFHMSSVLRVAAVYDPRNHIVQIQVDKLERTLREILGLVPNAVLAARGSDLYLNELRVPSRASQYKFIRTVLDELARREMTGIRFSPGFEREELNRFLEEFLRSGVTGTALLDACRASGEGHVVPVPSAAEDEFDESETELVGPDGTEAPVGEGIEDPGVARRRAQRTRGARALFHAAHMQDLEFRHAKRIVQAIMDTGSEEPLITPESLGRSDDDASAHAVSVCWLASSMGRILGLDRGAMCDLGVAALFHDLGSSTTANGPAGLATTGEDSAETRDHGIAGARLLARSTALSPTTLRCVKVALEHHMVPGPVESERATGSAQARSVYRAREGSPEGLVGRPMSVLSQIVAVADTFVSFRMQGGAVEPRIGLRQALSLTLAQCLGRFEDALLWSLARAIGVDSSAIESEAREPNREAA